MFQNSVGKLKEQPPARSRYALIRWWQAEDQNSQVCSTRPQLKLKFTASTVKQARQASREKPGAQLCSPASMPGEGESTPPSDLQQTSFNCFRNQLYPIWRSFINSITRHGL